MQRILPPPLDSSNSPNFTYKTGCFEVSAKVFQTEDIHIYYSCTTLGSPDILQLDVQSRLFETFPKAFKWRIFNYIIIPAHLDSQDSPILFSNPRCFWGFRKAFQVEGIQLHYLFLHHPWQPRYFPTLCALRNRPFWGLKQKKSLNDFFPSPSDRSAKCPPARPPIEGGLFAFTTLSMFYWFWQFSLYIPGKMEVGRTMFK